MIRALVTLFAALFGLAFGSFLNVCLSRWPEGESIVAPRSHCRHCEHALAWWENIPLLSWLALGGRCRKCQAWIGWRHPLVEGAVGALWALTAWQGLPGYSELAPSSAASGYVFLEFSQMLFLWLLVALAVLDVEHLWLPDALTLPGTALGFLVATFWFWLNGNRVLAFYGALGIQNELLLRFVGERLAGIAVAALLILIIRWLYQLIRHREGLGLGDAKLMAMLAAWLGLPGALLAFVLGSFLGALAALVLLARPAARRDGSPWAQQKLPLGTFLCIGGIVSALWGQPLLALYWRWAGF
ncbi:MAG: prepilin peptidase [Terracidiphilus sp.]